MISLPFVIRPPPTSVATARPTTHITFITLRPRAADTDRSEEHTSELQSRSDLVCRLLLEKKKKNQKTHLAHKAPRLSSHRTSRELTPEQSRPSYTSKKITTTIAHESTHPTSIVTHTVRSH